jgi:thioredoxin 1
MMGPATVVRGGLGAALGLVCLVGLSCAGVAPRQPAVVLHPQSGDEFRQIVQRARRPVLAVFTSESCASCRSMKTALEGLAADYAGRLVVVQADLAKTGALIREYNLMKVPTAVVLRDGREIARQQGFVFSVFTKRFINDALSSRP